MDTRVIRGQLKEDDYVAAQFLHLRPRPWLALVGALLVVMMIGAALYAPTTAAGISGALIFLIVYFALLLPWKARRFFRQYRALGEPVAIEIRDDGLFFKRENGEGLVPWTHIVKWRASDKLLLLYPVANLFHLIPAHFFDRPEDFRTFLVLIEERLGKAS